MLAKASVRVTFLRLNTAMNSNTFKTRIFVRGTQLSVPLESPSALLLQASNQELPLGVTCLQAELMAANQQPAVGRAECELEVDVERACGSLSDPDAAALEICSA
ncbi:hypothetical protein MHYP_G00316980 [Metynnis hypsauchen]